MYMYALTMYVQYKPLLKFKLVSLKNIGKHECWSGTKTTLPNPIWAANDT